MNYISVLIISVLFSAVSSQVCLQEINENRIREGKVPVTSDIKLVRAAEFHGNWMVANNCFSHKCPDEPSMVDRVNQEGYAWWGLGEIIAAGGFPNCAGAVGMWMNSNGHRGIMLGNYNNVGCSIVACHNCTYWNYATCVFGVPR